MVKFVIEVARGHAFVIIIRGSANRLKVAKGMRGHLLPTLSALIVAKGRLGTPKLTFCFFSTFHVPIRDRVFMLRVVPFHKFGFLLTNLLVLISLSNSISTKFKV